MGDSVSKAVSLEHAVPPPPGVPAPSETTARDIRESHTAPDSGCESGEQELSDRTHSSRSEHLGSEDDLTNPTTSHPDSTVVFRYETDSDDGMSQAQVIQRVREQYTELLQHRRLKVDDLKSALRQVGQPLSGRKTDLINRAITYLNRSCLSAATAHQRDRWLRVLRQMAADAGIPTEHLTRLSGGESHGHGVMRQRDVLRDVGDVMARGNTGSAILRNGSSHSQQPNGRTKWTHEMLLDVSAGIKSKDPFFKIVSAIAPPLSSTSSNNTIPFKLDQIYDEIKQARAKATRGCDFPKQIQVRCYCPMTKTWAWPAATALWVNQMSVTVTKFDEGIKIGKLCQRGENKVVIQRPFGHHELVFVVERCDFQDEDLMMSGVTVTPYNMCVAKIQQDFQEDADSGLTQLSSKFSLTCPVTKVRLESPSRGLQCKHLQCFDLRSYMMMNRSRPKWKCPVCNKDATFDSLIVDGYVKQILADTAPSKGEIEVFPDGKWTAVGSQAQATTVVKANALKRAAEMVELDSDDSDGGGRGSHGGCGGAIKRQKTVTTAAAGGGATAKPAAPVREVIEILSSDDDDDPPHGPPSTRPSDGPSYVGLFSQALLNPRSGGTGGAMYRRPPAAGSSTRPVTHATVEPGAGNYGGLPSMRDDDDEDEDSRSRSSGTFFSSPASGSEFDLDEYW
eukprot:GFYU01011646.1.p1 GENE.GFYU01011646.1~~GFYU01011646.1.p1  ORF type:complete len:678 (-),score=92.26 GFYU01011646.1:664-2697(-)